MTTAGDYAMRTPFALAVAQYEIGLTDRRPERRQRTICRPVEPPMETQGHGSGDA